jgi:5-methyltetrahydropteroyltriglutamate--homocysteine methyltransferase
MPDTVASKIRTTHTGSLPRPAEMLETMRKIVAGADYDRDAYEAALTRYVTEIVRKQVEAGIDVVNDGECSKPSFSNYIAERLAGFEARMPVGGLPVPTGPIGINGRDARMFPDYYQNVLQNNPFANVIRMPPRVCVGPIRYVGQEKVQRDIRNLKAAMAAAGAREAFIPCAGPVSPMKNEFYRSEDEYLSAFGDAMREEYQAVIDAGFMLQIDFPNLISGWDARTDSSMDEYRAWAERMIGYVNRALRGIPEDRVRFHTCYGVNFGPRLSDLQLGDMIDLILSINAKYYSFEAANPRHEHEWRVFESVKLPPGKCIIPGMVTHSNVMVEHPQAVADRIERWARVVGRENLMVGNDCGFQSTAGNTEIPISIAWAKLKALGDGASVASERLWA